MNAASLLVFSLSLFGFSISATAKPKYKYNPRNNQYAAVRPNAQEQQSFSKSNPSKSSVNSIDINAVVGMGTGLEYADSPGMMLGVDGTLLLTDHFFILAGISQWSVQGSLRSTYIPTQSVSNYDIEQTILAVDSGLGGRFRPSDMMNIQFGSRLGWYKRNFSITSKEYSFTSDSDTEGYNITPFAGFNLLLADNRINVGPEVRVPLYFHNKKSSDKESDGSTYNENDYDDEYTRQSLPIVGVIKAGVAF